MSRSKQQEDSIGGGKNYTPGDYLQFVKYQKKAQKKASAPSNFWRPLVDEFRTIFRESPELLTLMKDIGNIENI